MAKKKEISDKPIIDVEETLDRTEAFIEKNKTMLTTVVVIIIVAVGGFFIFRNYYQAPRERQSQSQIFMAQKYFAKDSLDLALMGDGNYPGFLDIIDDYGSTKAGNLSRYYAGIIYLHKGEFDEAISYLKKFKSKDLILSAMALGAIGDAYSEMDNIKEAVSYYEKASAKTTNHFTTPIYLMKAANTYEDLGDNEKALKIYQRLRTEFVRTQEGREAEKYYAKLSALLDK